MAKQQRRSARSIEGRQVNVALRDGTRLDDCNLVSTGRNCVDNMWLFTNGEDLFVALDDVVDVWETDANRPASPPKSAGSFQNAARSSKPASLAWPDPVAMQVSALEGPPTGVDGGLSSSSCHRKE
jgi:hypothetical protein